MTRSPRRGRATPIRSSIPVSPRRSSSSKPIPTSSRSTPISTRAAPTMRRSLSSTGADGAWSRRARPTRDGRRAASKRWRERRSWASATTSSCGCGRSKAAPASTSARRHATARSISAPTPRASAPARRNRGRVRQPGAGRAAAGRAPEGTGQGRAQEPAEGAAQGRAERQSDRQSVAAAGRRRAVGRDLAARDQVLEMRQHRQAGRPGEPRIEPDIDVAHHRRDVGFATLQAGRGSPPRARGGDE